MSKTVFCIAPSEMVATAIVTRLRAAGFIDDQISILLPDTSTSRDFAHEKRTKAPEGASAGAGAGGIVGGTVGLLAGIGLLAVPGVGPLIAAGPILAALSGAALGAAVGGVTGALVGMGIPEIEAKRYAGKIEDGNILISVHAQDAEEARRAKEVLDESGATDISVASQATAPVRK